MQCFLRILIQITSLSIWLRCSVNGPNYMNKSKFSLQRMDTACLGLRLVLGMKEIRLNMSLQALSFQNEPKCLLEECRW